MDKRSVVTRVDPTTKSKYERLCERAAIDLMTGYEKSIPFVIDEDWDRFIEKFPNAKSAYGEFEVNLSIESEYFEYLSQITRGNISKKDLLGAILRWSVRDDRRSDFNDYLLEHTESPEIQPKSSIVSSDKDFGTDEYMQMDRDELESEIMDDINSLGEAEN